MSNTLPVDISIEQYNELLKIKPKSLQSKYPFSAMDEEDVVKTLKQIELVYQNLTPKTSAFVRRDFSKGGKTNRWRKKNGGSLQSESITIFTL